MMRFLGILILCGLSCGVALGDDLELNDVEKQLVEQCNNYRVQNGLPALKPAKWLMERARAHCAWMVRNGSMTHSGGITENIAMGQSSVTAVTNTWINSGGHRANMVSSNTHIGTTGYTAPNGTIYWIHQFGGSEGSPVAQSGVGGSGGRSLRVPIIGRFFRRR